MKVIYSLLGFFVGFVFAISPVYAHEDGTVHAEDGTESAKTEAINQVRNRLTSEQSAKLGETCSRFTPTRLSGVVEERRGSLLAKIGERNSSVDSKRQEWDTKREEARALANTKRQEHYATMLERATTDEQKRAVTEFQQTVEKAVTTRREAQDLARDAYRKSVDEVLTTRKTLLEEATKEYKLSVEAAVNKAKLACENGTPLETARETLKEDLEVAKKQFETAKKDLPNVSEELKGFITTRKTAMEEAKKTFDETMKLAKETLKAALSLNDEPSSDESQTP